MKVTQKNGQRGVTALEMLIGLAFLLILAAFVAPNLQKDSGRKELNQALADFNQHVEMARFAARRLEKEITVDLQQGPRDRNHAVSFFLPGEPNLEPVLKEYLLPENIRISSTHAHLHIDRNGELQDMAQVDFKTERNGLLNESLLLQ